MGGDSVAAPTISLPKGGGAIRGIGEKFAANPVTGTGSMSVPLYSSPGRSGFGPQLSLSYDSGAGNGPFGFGWSLNLPQLTRKTDKGLPQYLDALETDVFVLSGAEDLVPLLNPDGTVFSDVASFPGYTIHRYRPRIEGLFARIERWTRSIDGDVHWRSISRDNVLSLYGQGPNARIVDPADARRIFTWLIDETRDDKGNVVHYEYKPEDGVGVDVARAHERNRGDRGDARRTANRYPKRIRYGNRVPLLGDSGQRPVFLTAAQVRDAGWMFELVFDYGEHPTDTPAPDGTRPWTYRADAFSSYRAGFEVRTARLCRRVLMVHHFADEPEVGDSGIVRSTDLTYSDERDPGSARNPIYTFLLAVTQTGYRRSGDAYATGSLPKVEFQYTQAAVQDAVHEVDAASLENLPVGLGGAYQWTDLHGEGVPGILTEQADAWFYKRNLSPLGHGDVRFAPLERAASKPNLSLTDGRAQFMDLAGDGQPDLAVLDGPAPGLYEHDDGEGWQPFRPFTDRLNRDTRDPNLKFIDLDGDGQADVLVSEDDAFVWHASLAESGFGPARRVAHPLTEEEGARLVFSDGTQSIYLADLSGDGLTDIVRIRNGEVCYWPNLGHGRFGAKITMDHAPIFDNPDQFDHGRIRLADIDGSGTTDIIYLHRDGVRLYFNQSGNSWSAPQTLRVFPRVDDLVSIVPIDLLGNGTACLVWSSPLPGDAGRHLRYVDLMGGQKPHLLVKTVNNLGAETQVEYAPSTRFYLQDKYAGRPWITRLPFPVHVVERVETRDRISGNRFVTRYAYHHGYFDGEEREFRGFGMVEQRDTEVFATPVTGGIQSDATNEDAASHVPPVLTRTWFHTGAYVGRDHVSDFFAGLLDGSDAGEYYREPGLTDAQARLHLLPDTIMPEVVTSQEEREACRALKGSMLRQEVYALDGTVEAQVPYTVTEQNFTLRRLQPREGNRHAVFFTHPREVVSTHYERRPLDPRVSHSLTLKVDDSGNVLESLSIGYGRRATSLDPALTADDRLKQTRSLVTITLNAFTHASEDDNLHRPPLPAGARTYELTGFTPENGAARFSFDEWARSELSAGGGAAEIPYEQTADGVTRQRRLIEHVQTLYRSDDLTRLLPLGVVESLALPGESYKLALTPGLLALVFKRGREGGVDEELISPPIALALAGKGSDEGGYVSRDGGWWIPSGRTWFDAAADVGEPALTAAQELGTARAHFYLPRKVTDPFDRPTVVEYDAYDLLVARTIDALDNAVAATNDYRVLQPVRVTDPNGNRTEAVFDALGLLVATAVMGKELVVGPGAEEGDQPDGFDIDPSLETLRTFVTDPRERAAALLGNATTRIIYDLDRYRRTGQPPFAATLARETHVNAGGGETRVQVSFSYSDGFGREVQKKIQAESGPAPSREPPTLLPDGDIVPGNLVRGADGAPSPAFAARRWVGTGRTVFNNKGKPVRQYEPFFSATHLYESEPQMTDAGVSKALFYDPVERVVATLHPNHTYEKVVLDAWRQTTHDVNDTVLLDPGTDPDVRRFFVTSDGVARTAANEYLPTWYAQRVAMPAGDPDRDAAQRAAAHANTPTVAHLDALGRPFLTVAHNRYERDGATLDEKYATRVELDIEGNQRSVTDAKGRVVMRYEQDMLGTRIHQASMEAGERWTLNDTAGKPIRAWDSRGFLRRMTYDELRRPRELFVADGVAERLAERTDYGEGQGAVRNHRGRVYQVRDGAGIVTSVGYDFKGNLLEGQRELLSTYRDAVDWNLNPVPNDGTFVSRTTFDALNRPIDTTSPDGSVYRATFNEANLLDRVDVRLRGAAAATPFVTNIDYNAKGQREHIDYGNGARTTYEYDRFTFRLIRIETTRPAGAGGLASQIFNVPSVVQDLRYTYDPIGNLTRVEDAALTTGFRGGAVVDPVGRYTYDALYRLIEAQGREHIGQTAFAVNEPGGGRRDHPFGGAAAHANDLQALRNYTERYEYDAVGNFEVLRHRASGDSWTRRYEYQEKSLLEDDKKSNRLTRTMLGNGAAAAESYAHDDHGNMTSMPHLAAMVWDFEDQLQRVDLGGGGAAYYIYDAAGQRVRKVIDTLNGVRQKARTYLGGFEIYREYGGNGVDVALERQSLSVMDDKQRIALVETLTVEEGDRVNAPAASQRYQLGNHLGSASVELDADGGVISYEEYHPYGTTAFQVAAGPAEVSWKRYRYTGKERDEESGLYYYGARYYAPWLGRWTGADPAGVEDGPNLFQYTRGNPVFYVDASGKASEPPTPEVESHYSVGAVLGRQAAEAMSEGNDGTAAWINAAATAWDMFGSERLSIVADKGTSSSATDVGLAALETTMNLFGGELIAAVAKPVARAAAPLVLTMATRVSTPALDIVAKEGIVIVEQSAAKKATTTVMSVLDRKFSDNPAIRQLWNEAAASARTAPDLSTTDGARKAYDGTMGRFITRLTNESNPVATEARAAFEANGFKFLRNGKGALKKNLPVLDLPGVEKSLAKAAHMDMLRASGQHMTKISVDPSRALDADNLAWMIARDNIHMDVKGKLAAKVRAEAVKKITSQQGKP